MAERKVVTCFLWHQGKVLLLRRSQRVGTYRGRWAGVSGYLDPDRSGRKQAFKELAEEVELRPQDVKLVREGEPLRIDDPHVKTTWIVHPFLFELDDPSKVRLDWEHVEARWVMPEEMARLETVPGLKETWERVSKRSGAA